MWIRTRSKGVASSRLWHRRGVHMFLRLMGGGEAVLVHSEGKKFEIEEWEQACEAARGVCIGISEDGADAMEVEGGKGNMVEGLKELVKGEVEKESRWRGEG